ncbi:MAG: hypothetical protein OXC80_10720 [Gammaproteobacteria bacterium]|nr:hypothetical protein [Gammaproteobacteria bacterium]
MTDKTIPVKERWAQAIGIENARYNRLADAYAQLGFSPEQIETHLQELDALEDESGVSYPFTKHSARYAQESLKEGALARGLEWLDEDEDHNEED